MDCQGVGWGGAGGSRFGALACPPFPTVTPLTEGLWTGQPGGDLSSRRVSPRCQMLAKQEEKALACLLNILTGGRYIYKKLRRRSIVTDRAAASSYGAQGSASFSAAELAAAVPCPSVFGGVGWGGGGAGQPRGRVDTRRILCVEDASIGSNRCTGGRARARQ